MTKIEQIEALQAQIDLLKEESKKEIQSKILPFIREGKAKCNFDGCFTNIFIEISPENEKELIKYIVGDQDGGWYHFGCPISDVSQIRYDDGRINIYFDFHGKKSEYESKFIEEIKALGIKIDFTEYKSSLTYQIKKIQDEFNSILITESKLI